MSILHELCYFKKRPINNEYIENLKLYLKNGIPATYAIEEAINNLNDTNDELNTTTTPLHLICKESPNDLNEEELEIIKQMVEILFEYGAGWCLTDINNDTPGCILVKRNLNNSMVYKQIVAAGVRAELLLRKVNEYNMKENLIILHEEIETCENNNKLKEFNSVERSNLNQLKKELNNDPSSNPEIYLKTKLEYKDNALITKDGRDGIMMLWETELMKAGCKSLFKGCYLKDETLDSEINILNIGFGMGIIDKMISDTIINDIELNKVKSIKHYICEAHLDVLEKLRKDGWYEKQNVIILEGRWQDQLNKMLSDSNIFFNGIYYDTFSESYEDMLELFNYIVGLLKPHGVFSFFNGLGADRQIVYDVYRALVEIDLLNFGLKCLFNKVEVPKSMLELKNDKNDKNNQIKSVWDDIKRSYWKCPVYYHPEIRFIDI